MFDDFTKKDFLQTILSTISMLIAGYFIIAGVFIIF
ncbi:hypothetical protein SYNTR_0800 [Candidatus Syntrophocurvum alkaliphilum]|uniref:Uncharacterized protein n=1 Tax=Candidatus Syntrophocurvum alkaliphilum TaxID=2293317 RepID=A0A6I6DGB7_9FIRM|nr:hypothetical protein SYNTR_0800 [Candidatus Syntrophocurvum alkaliphilum]